MNVSTLFTAYVTEPAPERWRGFPELMWNLGFEMDCYNSAPQYESYTRHTHTEKEIQDQLLSHMAVWTTQEVGNYVFSRYRELTHWSDYGYPEEKGNYFFERAFPILEDKLSKDWDMRNQIPSLDEFTEIVTARLLLMMSDESSQDVTDFAYSDEGQFYLSRKYNEYVSMYKANEINAPKFRGRYASEAAYYIKDMF